MTEKTQKEEVIEDFDLKILSCKSYLLYYMEKCEEVKELKFKLQEQARHFIEIMNNLKEKDINSEWYGMVDVDDGDSKHFLLLKIAFDDIEAKNNGTN